MRNVVVTGASRGLGLAITLRLAAAGYQVIAVARTPGDVLPTATGPIHFRACDLADIAGLQGFAKSIRGEFGSLYGLVNNAGIGTAGILSTMPEAAIERLVRMNITSPLTLTKYLVRPMMTARAGRVVNLSSIVATTGFPGLAPYAATKAAMAGFTRSLARELGPLGITVNAVAPGFIPTEMTHDMTDEHRAQIARRSALKRLAEADDVAAAVEFLLGDGAANITGTILTVDAGGTA